MQSESELRAKTHYWIWIGECSKTISDTIYNTQCCQFSRNFCFALNGFLTVQDVMLLSEIGEGSI